MMLVVRGAAKGLADEQRVEAPVTWINNLLRSPAGTQSWLLLPAGVWIIIGLSLMTGVLLEYTRFGHHSLAIRSNERTAPLSGVRIDAFKGSVFWLGAGLPGLAVVTQC